MSELSEITRIRSVENYERSKKVRDEEISKIHKLELVLSIIKSAKLKGLDSTEDPDILKKALKIVSVQNFIKLNGSEYVLSLKNFSTVQLSYTERKAVHEFLMKNINKTISPLIEYIHLRQKDNPELLNSEVRQREILELEKKRRKLLIQLVEVTNEKCRLLKTCTELKLGSFMKNELEVIHTNYNLNHVKANTLQRFIIQEYCTRTDHAIKAIKEVENAINAQLEED